MLEQKQKKQIDISFVILHYLVSEQTIKSIESIQNNIDVENYIIVIVDNGSNNGSIELINEVIKNNDKIVILKNKENLGFANGNNTGIEYINENYDCNFVCVLNNDVYLKSKNIYASVKHEYELSKFAVAGPKIYIKDGSINSNPKSTEIFSYKNVKYRQLEINIYYFLYKIHLDKIVNILKKRKKTISNTTNNNEKQYKVQLHGCFFIFSKKYFEYFTGLDPRTFLYMEEEILFQHLLNKNLVSVYVPEIEVFHEEDSSTNAVFNNKPRKKEIFLLKHHKKSIKILLDVMKEAKYINNSHN